MEEERRMIPTYTRVWQYPWLIRGIPGTDKTFWRPVPGTALVSGFALFGGTLILRLHGLAPSGLVAMTLWHVGLPALLGWTIVKLRLDGKRLDRWLKDRLDYLAGPQRHDRFRAVPAPAIYTYTKGGRTNEQEQADGSVDQAPGGVRPE